MEIRKKMKYKRILKMISLGVFISLSACHTVMNEEPLLPIKSPEHTLLPLSPNFSVLTPEAALHKQYLRLHDGKMFPVVGIIRVDGKSYRFLGGDSLRATPLFPLSDESQGWTGKYSYLFPGADWQKRGYDDSHWYDGEGAFGTEQHTYPVHTPWSTNDVYVRRHMFINNKESLKGHKLYMRYICDDQASFFCNGERILESGYLTEPGCIQLSQQVVDQLQNGDNVFAAHAYDTGWAALLDFGLYAENIFYSEADTATLKLFDVQATQTHFVYQCGEVELQLDFVSPALLEKENVEGCPVAFMTYQVHIKDEEHHDVEILFDVDIEWMFGNVIDEYLTDQEWAIAGFNNLYLGMSTAGSTYLYKDGHAVYSQKLRDSIEDSGVLLFAYNEDRALQYEGENLLPYWKKNKDNTLRDLLKSIGEEYKAIKKECDKVDYQWNTKAYRAGGETYARQIIPSYRNFISTHYLEISLDNKLLCFGNSLGNVREAFRIYPTLLFFNRIDWMKGLLDPIFEYCKDEFWIKKYPPHDIGLYPIVNRQISTEDHEMEVAADMLIMVAALAESENSFDYAGQHWSLLCKWGDFLLASMSKEELTTKLTESDEKCEKEVLGVRAYKKLIQLRELDN